METKYHRAILVMIFLILAGGFIIQGTTFAAESYHLGIALGLSGTGAPYCKEAAEGLEIAVDRPQRTLGAINGSGRTSAFALEFFRQLDTSLRGKQCPMPDNPSRNGRPMLMPSGSF